MKFREIYDRTVNENTGTWNIEGIAKNVIEEMKADGASLDSLEYYVRRIVTNTVMGRTGKRSEADAVSAQVSDLVEDMWEDDDANMNESMKTVKYRGYEIVHGATDKKGWVTSFTVTKPPYTSGSEYRTMEEAKAAVDKWISKGRSGKDVSEATEDAQLKVDILTDKTKNDVPINKSFTVKSKNEAENLIRDMGYDGNITFSKSIKNHNHSNMDSLSIIYHDGKPIGYIQGYLMESTGIESYLDADEKAIMDMIEKMNPGTSARGEFIKKILAKYVDADTLIDYATESDVYDEAEMKKAREHFYSRELLESLIEGISVSMRREKDDLVRILIEDIINRFADEGRIVPQDLLIDLINRMDSEKRAAIRAEIKE